MAVGAMIGLSRRAWEEDADAELVALMQPGRSAAMMVGSPLIDPAPRSFKGAEAPYTAEIKRRAIGAITFRLGDRLGKLSARSAATVLLPGRHWSPCRLVAVSGLHPLVGAPPSTAACCRSSSCRKSRSRSAVTCDGDRGADRRCGVMLNSYPDGAAATG